MIEADWSADRRNALRGRGMNFIDTPQGLVHSRRMPLGIIMQRMDSRYDELGLYHDPDDPRLFVPKRNPSLGWTINLEHPYGRTTLGLILMVPVVGIVITGIMAASNRP